MNELEAELIQHITVVLKSTTEIKKVLDIDQDTKLTDTFDDIERSCDDLVKLLSPEVQAKIKS